MDYILSPVYATNKQTRGLDFVELELVNWLCYTAMYPKIHVNFIGAIVLYRALGYYIMLTLAFHNGPAIAQLKYLKKLSNMEEIGQIQNAQSLMLDIMILFL
ncbi:hypothetical protein ACJX0J_037946 [Zea mays]